MLQIFFKVAETQRHRVAKFFSVTEFVKVPNTKLRQAQSPEYLNPKKITLPYYNCRRKSLSTCQRLLEVL